MMLDDFVKKVVLPSKVNSCFYHFTDTRNLPSIRQHGILSTRALRTRHIDIPAPGGNAWSLEADQASGMDAYVHLCFKADHPMEYLARRDGRIVNVTYLFIHPDVIKHPGAMITNGVSNKSGVVPQAPAEAVETLDLEVLYKRTDWSDSEIQARLKNAEKCEVLIPDNIPTAYILNLGNG